MLMSSRIRDIEEEEKEPQQQQIEEEEPQQQIEEKELQQQPEEEDGKEENEGGCYENFRSLGSVTDSEVIRAVLRAINVKTDDKIEEVLVLVRYNENNEAENEAKTEGSASDEEAVNEVEENNAEIAPLPKENDADDSDLGNKIEAISPREENQEDHPEVDDADLGNQIEAISPREENQEDHPEGNGETVMQTRDGVDLEQELFVSGTANNSSEETTENSDETRENATATISPLLESDEDGKRDDVDSQESAESEETTRKIDAVPETTVQPELIDENLNEIDVPGIEENMIMATPPAPPSPSNGEEKNREEAEERNNLVNTFAKIVKNDLTQGAKLMDADERKIQKAVSDLIVEEFKIMEEPDNKKLRDNLENLETAIARSSDAEENRISNENSVNTSGVRQEEHGLQGSLEVTTVEPTTVVALDNEKFNNEMIKAEAPKNGEDNQPQADKEVENLRERHNLLSDSQINRLVNPLFNLLHAKDDIVEKIQGISSPDLENRGGSLLAVSAPENRTESPEIISSKIDWAPQADADKPAEEIKPNYFGKLLPAKDASNVVPGDGVEDKRPVYFVGNGVQLPLQMSKDKDGALQLTVDVEKLCSCKEKTCGEEILAAAESTTEVETPRVNVKERRRRSADFGAENGDKIDSVIGGDSSFVKRQLSLVGEVLSWMKNVAAAGEKLS